MKKDKQGRKNPAYKALIEGAFASGGDVVGLVRRLRDGGVTPHRLMRALDELALDDVKRACFPTAGTGRGRPLAESGTQATDAVGRARFVVGHIARDDAVHREYGWAPSPPSYPGGPIGEMPGTPYLLITPPGAPALRVIPS